MNNNNTKRVRADRTIRAYPDTHADIVAEAESCKKSVADMVDAAWVYFKNHGGIAKFKKTIGR